MDIDRDTEEMLIRVLTQMKEDRYKYELKREARLWGNIQGPPVLKDLLSNYTKDELSEIRQNLELKGLSTLKKQELINALQTGIINSAHSIFNLFDDFRYKLVKTIARNDGFTAKFDLEPEQIDYFRSRGIIFTGSLNGKKVLAMPPEIVSEFKNIDNSYFRQNIKRNTEWIRLVQGILFYYGTLNFVDLVKITERTTNKEITNIPEMIDILLDAMEFYEEIRFDVHGFSHYRVFDSDMVLQEHNKRPGVAYYPFTYEQFYKAGMPGYVDKNYAFRQFSHFLVDYYDIDIDEAEAVVEECVYAVRIGEPVGSIIEFLQGQFEMDDEETLKEFVEQVNFLSNNTRQWFLKGYSPEELSRKDNKRVIPFPGNRDKINAAVGRNDPCPCGSGKKYKKCCGK